MISTYETLVEHPQSQGRVDFIVETPKYVYIFEFKLDGSAEEALAQIEERGYARPYASGPRPVYCIGASFSSATGTIGEWKTDASERASPPPPGPSGSGKRTDFELFKIIQL